MRAELRERLGVRTLPLLLQASLNDLLRSSRASQGLRQRLIHLQSLGADLKLDSLAGSSC